jgi:general stress protein 26
MYKSSDAWFTGENDPNITAIKVTPSSTVFTGILKATAWFLCSRK